MYVLLLLCNFRLFMCLGIGFRMSQFLSSHSLKTCTSGKLEMVNVWSVKCECVWEYIIICPVMDWWHVRVDSLPFALWALRGGTPATMVGISGSVDGWILKCYHCLGQESSYRNRQLGKSHFLAAMTKSLSCHFRPLLFVHSTRNINGVLKRVIKMLHALGLKIHSFLLTIMYKKCSVTFSIFVCKFCGFACFKPRNSLQLQLGCAGNLINSKLCVVSNPKPQNTNYSVLSWPSQVMSCHTVISQPLVQRYAGLCRAHKSTPLQLP